MPPIRGDVWLFDLGMAATTRPVLIVSVAFGDVDRVLVAVVPHTTELRRSQFEIPVSVNFLRSGAFLVQGVSTYPTAWGIRTLGTLPQAQFDNVMAGLLNWLGEPRS
jgi:mRNA interferase MazF